MTELEAMREEMKSLRDEVARLRGELAVERAVAVQPYPVGIPYSTPPMYPVWYSNGASGRSDETITTYAVNAA